MKIRPVGVELFHANRQADAAKLTIALRNFVNVQNNKKNYFP